MDNKNMPFGADAESTENFKEEFSFSNKNKEASKAAIDKSAKEFVDYMTSLSADVPELTEEEINRGVEKILDRAFPAEKSASPTKKAKAKRITLKVLFIAALLSALLFSCIYVVGNSKNVSIENGFVTFAKDTIQIVFFGEDEEEYISVDSLLLSLEEHGYDDIMFPEEFVTKSDEYKASVPVYSEDELHKQVTFIIFNDTLTFTFVISVKSDNEPLSYKNLDNAKTVAVKDTVVAVFKHEENSAAEFLVDEYRYYIVSDMNYDNMIDFAETIKLVKPVR